MRAYTKYKRANKKARANENALIPRMRIYARNEGLFT